MAVGERFVIYPDGERDRWAAGAALADPPPLAGPPRTRADRLRGRGPGRTPRAVAESPSEWFLPILKLMPQPGSG